MKHLLSTPKHVAIIMDGNGRWATKKGKLRIFGHKEGIKSAKRAIYFAKNHNFDALTLYAFSKENWNRSKTEVSFLMELFVKTLDDEIDNLHKRNIRLKVIGDISRFKIKLQNSINKSEKLTYNNQGLNLNIAANYSGRWDITQGARKLAKKIEKGSLKSNQINENMFCKYICMNKLSPVDLVIRTGGEYRISNFLLWQIAYSELFFTDTLWPDFNDSIFENAIQAFSKRKRKFGKIIS
ncbi:Ditrans,polycis-undecaprenyl-diphosphate synthase ((2E,6E)-farnesyl-diphosphate specific) [Candidatus Westeberhardia cardiocondylae]|uniref:Ditrans,polycis-undecaprenyl-diphosphate synthase ((2E,6E)-farnesyl-diphosphate specific) n=1 Tax=Candidatus Westeberhardia cardiocondylae TaxID=1594731 RepID=A0A0H5BX27_9ENTR|nr:polyprenyl diphosphate synthase [Candidatus Westeberhardia cardiocondylae]CEN32287.1 Ditrans,polycis-undecaprenyl-diphosphate synthase ((2E,6E)-farnesyl-diphosphate specific) [Candidatus Westeberhardia cardiocondylae]